MSEGGPHCRTEFGEAGRHADPLQRSHSLRAVHLLDQAALDIIVHLQHAHGGRSVR